MLYYLCREAHQYTIQKFLGALPRVQRPRLEIATYERLFATRRVPLGHLIFTDLDRLTPYELEVAESAARAVIKRAPQARIYNSPASVRLRYQLLRRLYERGLNPVEALRVDDERLPTRFPVFIRREAEALGPEPLAPLGPLFRTAEEYRLALGQLRREGRTLAGLIALTFVDTRDSAGLYRKYGVIRAGDALVPQHLLASYDWVVKRTEGKVEQQIIAEEQEFALENPHAAALRPIFDEAGISFGRVDYTLGPNGPVIFEINTNPSLPRGDPSVDDGRSVRRRHVMGTLLGALKDMGEPALAGGTVRLRPPEPELTQLYAPGLRRKLAHRVHAWRWKWFKQ
jgi:hypothetical protein